MHIIDKSTIEETANMEDIIVAVKKAYLEFSQGQAIIPARTPLNMESKNGMALFMPCYSAKREIYGVKIASVYPDNNKRGIPTIISVILLNDAKTGNTITLLEAGYITALRTGASSAVATDLMALPEASSIAMIGCGEQAKTQLTAICEVRDIENVFLFDVNKKRTEKYLKEMKEELNELKFIVAESANDAVREAEIIVTATTSKEPVFAGEHLNSGAHINAVGAFTPEMQEIDEETIKQASKVVVDSKEGVLKEAGDLIIPINKGLFSPEKIQEIGDIIADKSSFQRNPGEITLFKSVGLAILDITVASMIYDRVLEQSKGREINLR